MRHFVAGDVPRTPVSVVAVTFDYAVGGKHYPNNEASAYTALANCDYSNDVFVYVEADEGKETGTLEIGIKNPNRAGDGLNVGTWAVYDNWTLTYYDQTAAPMAVKAGKWGTFIAPFPVSDGSKTNYVLQTQDGVQAFYFDGDATGIEAAEAIGAEEDGAPVYNVAGQRVQKGYKGIVIKNGKKYLSK